MSEYAVVESITCAGCGELFPGPRGVISANRAHLKNKPEENAAAEVARRPPAKRDPRVASATPSDPPVRAEVRRGGRGWLTGPRHRNLWREPAMVAYIVILLAGIPLAFYRYGPHISPEALAFFKENGRTFGPGLFLIFQAIAALEAFRDEFFQGILCLLVPFYFIYYIYTRSENYIARLLFTLFLVAAAPDVYAGGVAYLGTAFDQVNAWIGGHEYEAGFGR